MAYAGVFDLAEPTLAAGETLEEFLATDDGFDPDRGGRAGLRVRRAPAARHSST